MLALVLAEVISLIKWILIISFAATAYYLVLPKYIPIKENETRMNRVTGQVFKYPFYSKNVYFNFDQDSANDALFWQVQNGLGKFEK